ncbi:hypothetical protein N878_01525 [Pseudomonas sp. EGD-AK9]|nr:hypothetical protein N878_01525 [Pseudomonas sp. EGD-AK9]
MGYQRISGIQHETQIRLTIFVERCGHTKDQSIDIGGTCKVGRRLETPPNGARNRLSGDVLDITLALGDAVDLGLIDIETNHSIPNFCVTKYQRQPDVTQTDNTDASGALVQATKKLLLH